MIYFVGNQKQIIYSYSLTDFSLKISFFAVFDSIFAIQDMCTPENAGFLTNRRVQKKPPGEAAFSKQGVNG